ncbi:TRAP-type mannitol/chloroaromatic compound transport system, substrate-binding protein [Desulfocicer vacuolatum DSM 3385]|uniref:TRAP-type mannitol/chloroaromatic compound transport system, substrate-binding protein n=1 Tax=Desulfocicer vacuolatum DSM 3385 TaxID=1121400 RepID=A0A1W2EDG9_9BACT|nr:hypothetical protein [Desulfocicer vacuolatum]SMD07707.1 TRAP-type mannitol/chloroaromatic compound transport system, substrate-binding protein [Desulfocicer vacuolatum DSM 3385]
MRFSIKLSNVLFCWIIFTALVFPGQHAAAKGPRTLEVHSVFPKGLIFLNESLHHLSTVVETLSQGKLKLYFRGVNEVVSGDELFHAVKTGKIDAAWSWTGYNCDKIPVCELIASMPFGLKAEYSMLWMWNGGGLEILQKGFDNHNIIVMPTHIVISEAAGWYQKEINTIADFKGLRIRIAGIGGEVLSHFGAIPSMIPVEKIFNAIASGQLDALEFTIPDVDQSFGFEKFARYYYFPGWHQPSSWNALMINKKIWNTLSEHERNILTYAARINSSWSLAMSYQRQMSALEMFKSQGVEIRRFSDDILNQLLQVSRKSLKKKSAANALLKQAHQSQVNFMKTVKCWNNLQQAPSQFVMPGDCGNKK